MPIPAPMANAMLFGHAAAEQRWERALASGRMPHGWLLSGPRGVGKATLAYRMARRLLAEPRARLVDVALSVGFQTQAHFTTVFKRFVGLTPHRWRHTIDSAPAASPLRAAA